MTGLKSHVTLPGRIAMLSLKYITVLGLLLGSTPFVFAQGVDCDKRVLVVNARDKQGRFLPLQPSDFRARLGKKDAAVLSVTRQVIAPRVVILLDKSGSMGNEDRTRALQFISSELVRTMPGNPQFGLVVFAQKVLETVDFGHARADVLSAIDSAGKSESQGGTALRDALLRASDLFGTTQLGDAVVIFSDGGDNHSNTSQRDLERSYSSKGIRAFPFIFVDRELATPEETYGRDSLAALAAVTGGSVGIVFPKMLALKTLKEATPVVQQLEDVLSRYYVVQIQLPESVRSDASLQLEPFDAAGRRSKDVRLSFPQRLAACALPSAHP